jgi:hypothetical protein
MRISALCLCSDAVLVISSLIERICGPRDVGSCFGRGCAGSLEVGIDEGRDNTFEDEEEDEEMSCGGVNECGVGGVVGETTQSDKEAADWETERERLETIF